MIRSRDPKKTIDAPHKPLQPSHPDFSPLGPHPLPRKMPYQLCVLGCGTMGVAVLSGVLDNLRAPRSSRQSNGPDESGPSTPMGSLILDNNSNPTSLPDRRVPTHSSNRMLAHASPACSFIATVNRAESAKKLRRTFFELGGFGPSVEVRQASENVKSVAESDVILLWCAPVIHIARRSFHRLYLRSQLQASTRRASPPCSWHVRSTRGEASHLDPGGYDHLDDARVGPVELHGRAEHAQHAEQGASRLPNDTALFRLIADELRLSITQIREGMTVVSSLDPSDSKTPVNREILMALFTPLGKCRFMDEKVRSCSCSCSSSQTDHRVLDSTLTQSQPSAVPVLHLSASSWKPWPMEVS